MMLEIFYSCKLHKNAMGRQFYVKFSCIMNILAAISVGTPRGANVPKVTWGEGG